VPRGACVTPYRGVRGTSWRIQYIDADGRQIKETLGREPDWNRLRAERALGARLAEVEKGMRKPRRRTFDDLADEFEAVAIPARPRKKSTVIDYKATVRNHLRPAFGHLDLGRLSHQPDAFERYAANKIANGLSPKTVRNHLVLLGLMFRSARRWRWVAENPMELVEKPAMADAETETIDASTIADLLAAYRILEADADDEERFWFAAARRMTVVALSTGLRRGELLGLRWKDVDFLERRLHVRQQFVRNEITTPKSKAGRRSLGLGPVAVEALEEQYRATRCRADESIVFCHPALGTPLDPSKLTRYARKALDKAEVPSAFRPWHGMRHTALTETAAAGVPRMFVQAKAGHAHGSTTERYLHAQKTSYPDAAELAESRIFSASASTSASNAESPGGC
jgi:integrase